jgi:acyl-CoA thioesterase-1
MYLKSLGAGALLLLAACGSEAPASQEAPQQAALGAPLPAIGGPERTILAFGDSLFAGYNLEEDQGYPEQLQAVLRSRGINARVIDAGVSGDTTQAGAQRIGFVLDNIGTGPGEKPELAIVELGGNDLLRQIPPTQTRANLTAILQELREREIPVLLMGMRAPPNLGPEFQAEFDGLYPALAEEYGADLVPFFLEPVYDKPELILPDRIHPTADGITAIVAATVDAVVEALPEPE